MIQFARQIYLEDRKVAEISLLKEKPRIRRATVVTPLEIGGRTSDDVPLAATLLVHYHENQLARPTAPMSGTQFITPMFQARDVMGPTIDLAQQGCDARCHSRRHLQ